MAASSITRERAHARAAPAGRVERDGRRVAVSAADYLPRERSLAAARRAAAKCRGCPLWERATQTVFGEGRRRARLMLVGETPGDREDLAGRPFVGPAGQLLDRALAAAGIERAGVYVTNTVKHFKWEPRGKRRLHARPSSREVSACLPWLELEIELVRPEGVLCLGATAAHALLGAKFSVTRSRGTLVESRFAPRVMATVHPSALLRARERAEREAAYAAFVADLVAMREALS